MQNLDVLNKELENIEEDVFKKPTFQQFKQDVFQEVKSIRGKFWSDDKIKKQMKKYDSYLIESYTSIGIPPYTDKWGILRGCTTNVRDEYTYAVQADAEVVADCICG